MVSLQMCVGIFVKLSFCSAEVACDRCCRGQPWVKVKKLESGKIKAGFILP